MTEKAVLDVATHGMTAEIDNASRETGHASNRRYIKARSNMTHPIGVVDVSGAKVQRSLQRWAKRVGVGTKVARLPGHGPPGERLASTQTESQPLGRSHAHVLLEHDWNVRPLHEVDQPLELNLIPPVAPLRNNKTT